VGPRRLGADSRGFTLIEVSITMFFMLFIIQGIAMVSLYAQRSSIYARRLTSATTLAEKALEKYRNTDYDNLSALYDGQVLCFDGNMQQLASCGGDGVVFTQTTTVTVDPAGLAVAANITEMEVTVTWEQKWAWSSSQLSNPQEASQARIVSYISKF